MKAPKPKTLAPVIAIEDAALPDSCAAASLAEASLLSLDESDESDESEESEEEESLEPLLLEPEPLLPVDSESELAVVEAPPLESWPPITVVDSPMDTSYEVREAEMLRAMVVRPVGRPAGTIAASGWLVTTAGWVPTVPDG